MHRTLRLQITDLNPHLTCVLCGGYYIDATTITECLHSFCRTCIVRYLEGSKYCPICDVQVHKTRPLLHIHRDKTLQDLVYKLVPNLFKNEMERRRQFYAQHPEAGPSSARVSGEERGEIVPGLQSPDKKKTTDDEQISLSLEYSENGKPADEVDTTLEPQKQCPEKRYLLCPSGFTVSHLKKFIKTKFELSSSHLVHVFHSDEPLGDHYTLMDVAYIYTWRRKGPLRLFFTIYLRKETPGRQEEGKKRKISESSDKTEENDSATDSKRRALSPPTLTLNGSVSNNMHVKNMEEGNNTTSSNEELLSKPESKTLTTTASVTASVQKATVTATMTSAMTPATMTAKPVTKTDTPAWLMAAMANAQKQAQASAQTQAGKKTTPVQKTKTLQKTEKVRSPPKSTLEKALLAPSSKVFVQQQHSGGNSALQRALGKSATPVLSRVLAPGVAPPGARPLTPALISQLSQPRTTNTRSLTSSPEPVNTTTFLSKITAPVRTPVSGTLTQTRAPVPVSLPRPPVSAPVSPLTRAPVSAAHVPVSQPSPQGVARPQAPNTASPLDKITQNLQMAKMKSLGMKPTKPVSQSKAGMVLSETGPKAQEPGQTKNVKSVPASKPGPKPSLTLAKTIQKLAASQQTQQVRYPAAMAAMNNMMVSMPTSSLMTSGMTTITSSPVLSPVKPPVSPLLNQSQSSILSVPTRSLPATNAAMAALKPMGPNVFKIMSQHLPTSKAVMTSKTAVAVTSKGQIITTLSNGKPVTSKTGVTSSPTISVPKTVVTSTPCATVSKTTVTSTGINSSSFAASYNAFLSRTAASTASSQSTNNSTMTSSVAKPSASSKLNNGKPPSVSRPSPVPISSPGTKTATSPVRKIPSSPGGKIPSPSVGKTPSPPVGKTPSPPVGKIQLLPVGKTPSPPVGKSPSPPVGKTPSPPVGKSPSPPVRKSPPPAVSKTASPSVPQSSSPVPGSKTPPASKSPGAPPSPAYPDPPQETSLDLSKKRKLADTNKPEALADPKVSKLAVSDSNSNSETCLNGQHVNGGSPRTGGSCPGPAGEAACQAPRKVSEACQAPRKVADTCPRIRAEETR